MTGKKGLGRRAALGGGAALALGGAYLALKPGDGVPHASSRNLPPPGTLRRGNVAEPETLDPSLSSATWEDYIIGDMMVGLMTLDSAARPIPGVATEWSTSPDGLSWTFKLRSSQWSDGAPVTADDFIFAWRRILDPQTAGPYAYFLYAIKNAAPVNAGKMPLTALGVSAPDPHTITINLEHPAPYLLEMLTHVTLNPQPAHVVKAKGKDWTRPGNYVSNGPYVLKDWVPNDRVTLVKNPHFYDAANVALDTIIFYPTNDYSAALRRLQAGEIDLQMRFENNQFGWIKSHMPELINPVPQLILDLAVANMKRKPLDDIRVRHAINLSINREAITDKIIRVGYVPAYNVVPPGIANYSGNQFFDFKGSAYAGRIAQAQSLMRQAGFGPDKKVRLNYLIRSTAAGSYRAVAAAIQQMLSLIYIDMVITPSDAQIFYKTIQEHDFDLAQPGWNADFNDASNFLDLFRKDSGNNWGNYNNPAFDAMMDAAQADINIESRGAKMAAAESILLKDYAAIPLFFWVSGNLVRPYVKGWTANATDSHRSRWLSIDQKARAAIFT